MSFIEDLGKAAAQAFLPVVRTFEAQYVKQGLEKIYERDPEKHAKLCRTGKDWLDELMIEAEKTKTKFDDTAVGGLLDAVVGSAEDHDVELPA